MSNGSAVAAQHLSILETSRLFIGLDKDEIAQIASQMVLSSPPRGRIILQHGDCTTGVYFLLSGVAVGQLVATNGRQIVFSEVAVGDHFGELSTLDGAPRSITISATTDCVLAKLDAVKFQDILMSFPQVSINLAKELGARLRGMNERVFGLVMHDVETRVALHLMQLAQDQGQLFSDGIISDPPTHEVIANFVGSNREAVSRAIAKLNKSDIVESTRKRVVVLNFAALLATASGDASLTN